MLDRSKHTWLQFVWICSGEKWAHVAQQNWPMRETPLTKASAHFETSTHFQINPRLIGKSMPTCLTAESALNRILYGYAREKNGLMLPNKIGICAKPPFRKMRKLRLRKYQLKKSRMREHHLQSCGNKLPFRGI